MVSLKHKTIIITGASSGIGKALALELAKEECNLVLAARRIDKINQLIKQINNQENNSRAIGLKTDVTKEKDVKRLFTAAENKFGRIDILINNAGRGLCCPVEKIGKKEWDSLIGTNLTGVFLCTKEAVEHMKRKKVKGHIITVCSIAGLYGAPKYSAYCASKHGVAGFQRSIWFELRKKGIKVSTIYPARVQTEFFNKYEKTPSKRQMIDSRDIAKYIVCIAKRVPLRRGLKRLVLVGKRIKRFVFP